MVATARNTGRPADWGEARTKTVTWFDPLVTSAGRAQLSGLEHIQAMIRGELAPPPMAALMGLRLWRATEGEVEFRCSPDESVYNPIGVVHGGLVCTLLDSAAGCALQSTLPFGVGYTSIEIKVSYLRPVSVDSGELRAIGRVTKSGRRVGFAEAEVLDGSGRPVATASSSLLVFPLELAASAPQGG